MDAIVIAGAGLLTGLLAWYFFAPRASKRATVEGNLQVLTITVKGGYSPSVVEVVQGARTRLLFDRQETGDCSSRIVFPDFKVNQNLPAYAATAVEFVPELVGDFGLACGMNIRLVREAQGSKAPIQRLAIVAVNALLLKRLRLPDPAAPAHSPESEPKPTPSPSSAR